MSPFRKLIFRFHRSIIWGAVGITSAVLILSTWSGNGGIADLGPLILNLVILFITATTLQLTVPEPARLWVDRQSELGIDDLIFYVEGDSSNGLPRDVLLQMHVAVSNVGGRKAVLSKLELVDFLDDAKCSVAFGQVPTRAMQYSIRDHRVTTIAVLLGQQNNLERFSASEEFGGPFVLAPDDVITLRLRTRGGIDWTDKWTLDGLKTYATALERPIKYARLSATYRRSDELVAQEFDIPLEALQQSLYVEALRLITSDFTIRPDVGTRIIQDF